MSKIIELFRIIYFGLIMAVTGMLGLILAACRPFHKNNTYPMALFMRVFVTPILGLKVQVEGYQKAVDARPCVFISNHQNNFDIVLAAEMVPPGVVSLGKKQMIYFPIFGWYYWLAGHILIDRSNRKKAFESMKKVKNAINNEGKSVWIMPEGTRSKGRGILPFKKGAFHTAIQAQCPILPMAISTWEKGVKLGRLRGNIVKVTMMDPIPTKGMTTDDVNALKEKCEKLIREENARLDKILDEHFA